MPTTIGAKLQLDGEKEFRTALKETNDSLKVLGSELKVVSAEYGKNDKSLDALTKRQDVLSRTYAEQQEKVKLLQQRLTEAAQAFGETDSRTKALQIQLNNANAEMIKTQKELQGVTTDLKTAEKGEDAAGDAAEEAGKQAKASGEDAEKGSKGWETLGGVCKAVGTAMAAAAATAAGAAFALGKSVVDAYADYEQLAGGVETLFGVSKMPIEEYAREQGISIEKAVAGYTEMMNAQDTVFSNANKAYKTAGLSANEYMETVTGFSASLIQSLGGNTSKAAELADQAIIDMADNANKMGSDMSSIQNAYQGFAKQNYNMLDNLKLGYGGTKEEMQRLLADAKELSGVEYDIDSYADIIEAIHVIQTDMGITGTTAKEATETISGSISALGATWDNLLIGLGNPSADVGELVSYLVDAFITVVDNITPVLEQLVQALPEALEAMAAAAVAELPLLLKTVVGLFKSILEMLLKELPELIPVVIDAVMTIVDTLIENLPLLVDSAIKIVLALVQGITEALPDLIPATVDAVLTIVDTLIDNLDLLVDAAIALILALADGLIQALPKLVEKAPEIVIKLVKGLIEAAPKLFEASLELILKIGEGLASFYFKIVEKGREIVDSIRDGFKEKVDGAAQWGKDLIDNFVSGITQKWEDLKSSVRGVAQTVKDILGFSEPKEGPLANFHTFAPDMMDLFIKGIRDNTGKLRAQLEESFDVRDQLTLPEAAITGVAATRGAVSESDTSPAIVYLTQPVTIEGRTITTLITEIMWENGQAYARNLGTAM